MFIFDVETLGKQSNSVILSMACIHFNPDEQPSHTELKQSAFFAKLEVSDQPFQVEELKTLEELLQDALETENYELAAEIRDEMNKNKKN